ncbi:MAG TPA: hypothetical protein VK752_20645 [Bryobacteraceae bacterium]|nr:hypothetical protein [Bryobacteraceae bacterium]
MTEFLATLPCIRCAFWILLIAAAGAAQPQGSNRNPERIKAGQTKLEVSSIMGQPPQTKGHGHKETWFYEIGPDEARYVLVVEFVDGKVTRSHPLLNDAKRQKEAEKKAANAALEASDHLTVPLSGWNSQTASGEPGCLSLHEMAFRRDAIRGWGGLLGGGRNAYLGVSSSLVGVVSNECAREVLVSIYSTFFNGSGLRLGENSVDILVPASESRAFQVPWACSDGANYIGGASTTWIPNCPADTARYVVRYE